MVDVKRRYLTGFAVVGVAIFGATIGLLVRSSADSLSLLLIALAILASWVRIELDPPCYIDLAPFVMFAALLTVGPVIALIAAIASTFVGSRFFNREPWSVVANTVGEEGMVLLPVTILANLIHVESHALESIERLMSFGAIVGTYIAMRLLFSAVRAYVVEGMSVHSFLRNTGKYMIGHIFLLALLAMGLTVVYLRVGYLALPLAMIALMEFYSPGKLIGEQRNSLFANLAVIAQAIDLKDEYTFGHLHKVETLAIRTARAMQLPENEVRRIRIGALMHDIGKIGVSGKIIRKPAKLDPDEWTIMKRHPSIAAEIMRPIELLSVAAELVRHHHENYDGTGYPDGLKGEDIPLGSRIIMVADSYDAIIRSRPYRKPRSKEEALLELHRCAGTQFDPKVVEAFEAVVDSIQLP
jgi:putative nucleotidyltransferase with HDIG domain